MTQSPLTAAWLSLFGLPDQKDPFSGDVSQWFKIFSPTVNVNGRGDPELEGEIVREVATYGAQIGTMSEVLLALALKEDPPEESLAKMRETMDKITVKKEEYQLNAAERARKALLDLQKQDPKALAPLLAEFRGSERPG